MKSKFAERIKQRIIEVSERPSADAPLSYPESSFTELNEAGLCKPFTTRIPVSTVRVLEILAESVDDSRSSLVNDIILEAVERICDDKSMKALKERMVSEANQVIEEHLKKTPKRSKVSKRSKRHD